MAEGFRKSTREVKLNRKEGFYYDEESLRPLSQRNNRSDVTSDFCQRRAVSESVRAVSESDSVLSSDNSVVQALTSWSVLDKLPLYFNQYTFPYSDTDVPINSNAIITSASVSQSQYQSEYQAAPSVDGAVVQFSSPNVNIEAGCQKSSGRSDFFNLDNNYFSASLSSVFSDMAENDNATERYKRCGCKLGEASGCPECSDNSGRQLASLMEAAISKIDALSNQVRGLETRVISLEGKSDIDSDARSASSVPSHRNVQKSHKHKSVNKNSKTSRIGEERDRSYKVVVNKMKKQGKNKESEEEEVVSSGEGEEVDLHGIRSKMDKKQKKKVTSKVNARLGQAGAQSTDDDFGADSSAKSGNESSGESNGESNGESSGESSVSKTSSVSKSRHRRRRKVRSGAEVKRRPVVRTELWPHTIAIENDGIEVTSEDIILSKFMSCFTSIMNECKSKTEAAGRSVLLQAIFTVLECLSWAEARTFHNIVMVKVEQDRISWKDDFAGLADDFIEKKVRQGLKSRGNGSQFRGNSGFRSYGRGYGGYNGRYRGRSSGNGRSAMYANICKMWNYGTCSYGDRCRFKHCCWSCHEAGKTGEDHKASTHRSEGGSQNTGQNNQPV